MASKVARSGEMVKAEASVEKPSRWALMLRLCSTASRLSAAARTLMRPSKTPLAQP
jgi:hypothetical protein